MSALSPWIALTHNLLTQFLLTTITMLLLYTSFFHFASVFYDIFDFMDYYSTARAEILDYGGLGKQA